LIRRPTSDSLSGTRIRSLFACLHLDTRRYGLRPSRRLHALIVFNPFNQGAHTMNTDTTASCTQAQVDALLGRKIINRMLIITSQTIAAALAFCCSSFWLGLLAYIVVGLLLAALALIAVMYMGMFVTDDKFESLGHHVGSALGTVRGWFSSKEVATEEIAAA
jgi:hypothetical protein